MIASGAPPFVPPIPGAEDGLDKGGVQTWDTVWTLDAPPKKLPDIVGGALLMVGVLSDDAAALRLVRQAGTMRYSAVVVKKRYDAW